MYAGNKLIVIGVFGRWDLSKKGWKHLVQWKPVITRSSGSIDQTRNISGLTDITHTHNTHTHTPPTPSPPSSPPLRMACIRCRSSHIMNKFTIKATIFCKYAGTDKNN